MNSEMTYAWRSALIVPGAQRETADGLASAITGGDAVAEGRTYSVPLSATGAAPATHWGCCTAVDTVMLGRMQAALGAGMLTGVRFWRWDAATCLLVSSSSSVPVIGSAWGWAASLVDAGLQVVMEEPL